MLSRTRCLRSELFAFLTLALTVTVAQGGTTAQLSWNATTKLLSPPQGR
jgi:hypothetical protein